MATKSLWLVTLLAMVLVSEERLEKPHISPFQFTHHVYNATIYENSSPKTYIESSVKMGIQITEAIENVKYKIVSGDNMNVFKAEEYLVGDFCFLRIRTRSSNMAVLNREVKDNYLLTVQASDGTSQHEAWTKVMIQILDKNDLRPLFSPLSYTISITEDTPLRSSVARVTATDADIGSNAAFYYAFKDKVDMFAIHPSSGVVTLAGSLNYTTLKQYSLEILAVDRMVKLFGGTGIGSVAKLTVNVEQARIRVPGILSVHLTSPGTDHNATCAIITVEEGVDAVNIVDGDPSHHFSVVPFYHGSRELKLIYIKEANWADNYLGYNLSLQAGDKSNPTNHSPVKFIHVPAKWSEALKFEEDLYKVRLCEFAPPNSPVLMVKAQPKLPNQTYHLEHNHVSTKFRINPRTGLITTAAAMDFLEQSHFELKVKTSIGQISASIIIDLIDTNNNAPEFRASSYQGSIDENAQIGTSILTVNATDKDQGENGYVTYSIANVAPVPFGIHPFTGTIVTSENLDYELMQRVYHLRVWASDWGSPYHYEVEVPVTIYLKNLNDNEPLFEKNNCRGNISRNLTVGYLITTVSAVDADELQGIRYQLLSGNELDFFDLNPISGALILKHPLSYSPANEISFFNLKITATDGENYASTVDVNLTVTDSLEMINMHCNDTGAIKKLAEILLLSVKPHYQPHEEDSFSYIHIVNAHSPQFDIYFPSSIDIIESIPVYSTILNIHATDPDSGFNGKLVYVISDGNEDSCFVVEMETGELKVVLPLDHETKNLYILNITIYDLGKPQKFSWRLLTVHVLDANDNKPIFLQDSYSAKIHENVELGTPIAQVKAKDNDLGENGEIKYSLLTVTKTFSIDKTSGIVHVTGKLDREFHPMYVLRIEARDQPQQEPQLFSIIDLTVILEDVNDNPPQFVPPYYRVRVPEDIPVGTVIVWLEAYDPDLGPGGEVKYSLITTGENAFRIDRQVGAIRTNKQLDFESKNFYNLTAHAIDSGKPYSLNSTCYVEIEVIDVNENLHRPHFSSFVFKSSVSEGVPVGTSVLTLTAQDEDRGKDGAIRYSIKGGSGLGIFTINEKTGTIQTVELLDCERCPHYWLTVLATDLGAIPGVTSAEVFIKILDVNDNPPQTTAPVYYTSIIENSPKDKSVLRIDADDPDSSSQGQLTFRITSESPRGFFAIDPKTGLITTTVRKLDREKRDEHNLEVAVSDNGVPPRQSTAKVVVDILDENDNVPKFPEVLYNVRLLERNSSKEPEPIYKVIASDQDIGPNADVTYSIEENPEEGKFNIHPKSGMVSSTWTFTAGDYDILTIRASDNGSPQKSATVRLHIEWIQKPSPSTEPLAFDEPHFNFAVMETDPVNHMVGVTSTELTKSQLWFDIIGGNDNEEFEIEKNSGTITIAKLLNASQTSNYNLTVQMMNGTNAVTTQAYIRVIDINEHRPQFLESKYEVWIPEDTPRLTEILQIRARDTDGRSKLLYTIQSSVDVNSQQLFHLDPTSGVLLTTNELDYESMHLHILTIMVRDQEVPVKRNFVRAVINVEDSNDHPPRFTSPTYKGNVTETAPLGSEVLHVTALDKDTGINAEIMYSIQSGNSGNMFSIDPVSGKITVVSKLDQAVKGSYDLTVKAQDQGYPQLSTLANVDIIVVVSDNSAPKFLMKEYYAEISEATDIGSSVIMVTAISQSAVTYEIKDGNIDDIFHINLYSGVISVHKVLDFEKNSAYKLKIKGTNMAGLYSSIMVLIDIIDENDNPPVLVQSQYVGKINENSPINSIVLDDRNAPLVIQATDRDKDANGMLVFQIMETDILKYFAIDSNMGTLSTAAVIDHEATSIFHLTVQVHDRGQPSLFAAEVASITIMVTDVNDCPPRFEKELYESTLLIPAHKGTEVLTVKAVDADSDNFSKITYCIIEGNNKEIFNIDSSTGLISVRDTANLKGHFELTVRASDGIYKSTALVKIKVSNLKESSLIFAQSLYSFSVLENTTLTETLGVVKASGNQLNEPIFYYILNPDERFRIVYTAGAFQTTGVVCDREEQEDFEFVVEARDMRNPPRVAHTLIKVFVEDINDNAPGFVHLPYLATVQDDAEPGDVIYQVTADDKDTGDNAVIHYSLVDHYRYFWIDPYLGDISLSEHLDSDVSDKYILTVIAQDRGDPPLYAQTEVVITVRDKITPRFEKAYYRVRVPENISPYTPILHVHANNPSGFRVIYNIVKERALHLFSIEFKAGVLNVIDSLDYESQTKHVLTARATDSVTGSYTETIVEIEVEDVNDNPPVFTEKVYGAVLSEASAIGTSVVQVSANDADSGRNKIISYQFAAVTNSSEYFHIDTTNGLVTTARTLDYEQTQYYSLTVRAVDNGIPPLSSDVLLNVNISDFNDNPPTFRQNQYETTISEVATCGHFVIRVQARDPDSMDIDKLEYIITEGNEQRHFTIGTKSGIISVSNSCKKILEANYHLNVSVSDRVFRRSIPVQIKTSKTNKFKPIFDQNMYEVELAENVEVGTHVIELTAVDPDSGPYGNIDYTIINKLAREKFSIDDHGRILTSQKLDRENSTEKVIAIKVMAKDGGGKVDFCTVNIILTDENDNAPQFQAAEYKIHIPASTLKGAPVIQIVAVDADEGMNADVTYSVVSSEDKVEEILEINPLTGFITIKESLIGLENNSFTYYVKAQDGGSPQQDSCVPVVVKVIPPDLSFPRFSEPLYSFSASEDLPAGSEIGVITAEADQPVIYSLVKGNTDESNKGGVFTLDKNTGTLKIGKNIDHERTKWYKIDVIAQCFHGDLEVASSVSISIHVKDVNDNQPIFEANPYKAFIPENMPAGTTVIQVTANDQDTGTNGHVTYSLSKEFDDVTDVFAIDGESGWLTTLKELDCETKSSYKFGVVAFDHGGKVQMSSTAIVEVEVTDENDNSPQFTKDIYKATVNEDSKPGEVVVVLSMVDADITESNRHATCYITDGDLLGQFAIESFQNEWRVYVKEILDREEREKYILNITATDGNFLAESAVEVLVHDINDNSPHCQQLMYSEAISEGAPWGQFILKVSAKDSDAGINAQITYTLHGPGANKFRLDPQTGELMTVGTLDRESQAVYNLVAKAADGSGLFCEADISIVLQDVNDNPPKFSASQYAVSVFDNTTVKTPVAVVHARDPDVGLNAEVTYSLVDSANEYFTIDELSGVIYLAKSLYKEQQKAFSLMVQATDHGFPQRLSSFVTVVVSVIGIEEFIPVFIQREYVATIPENVNIGLQILSVSALTRDVTNNAQIIYTIMNGNDHGKFRIDSKTGAMYVNRSLDYESCQEYYLSIDGNRKGRPLFSDSTTVIINVTDVNDNPPKFSHSVYNAEISEDAPHGELVLKVTATDRDGPLNNLIHYSIMNGDPNQHFRINPKNGEILLSHHLDREEISSYSLTVQAIDNGEPPLFSHTALNIQVLDVNDNPPMFFQFNYSVVIQENEPIGSSVLQLLVVDRDSGSNGPPFLFSIAAGNEGSNFHIDQQGLLKTQARLQQKVRDQYILQVQVTDSGQPPLSSSSFINIRVIKESRYPPSVLPLQVFIVTSSSKFPGGFVGKIHATDLDLHDTLTYSTVPGLMAADMFSIGSADGKVLAQHALEAGHYTFNVSVTDRKFITTVGAQVHVTHVTPDVLNHGVLVELVQVTPEKFISNHWQNFQRSLANILQVNKKGIELISMQPAQGSPNLDVLLVVKESEDSFYKPEVLQQKLTSSAVDLKKWTGIQIERIIHRCPNRNCQQQHCEGKFQLDMGNVLTYTTTILSFIVPRYLHYQACSCNDSSLRFTGDSYMKYHYLGEEGPLKTVITFRIQTLQSEAVVMYTNGTDSSLLEITNGNLMFTYACDGMRRVLSVSDNPVNNGLWHSVLVEVTEISVKLVLDTMHIASAALSETCRRSDFVFFGGKVQEDNLGPNNHKRVIKEFEGCLGSIRFQRDNTRKDEETSEPVVVVETSVGIETCCPPAEICSKAPCQNGGTCTEIPSGGYVCKCPKNILGVHCELVDHPCLSQPCLYGGTCIPQQSSYTCNCTKGNSGPRCKEDFNECLKHPCMNNGSCENFHGFFNCSCASGYTGNLCETFAEGQFLGPAIVISHDEIIAVVGAVLVACILVALFVIFRKLRSKKKKQSPLSVLGSNELSKSETTKNSYCDLHSSALIPLNILKGSAYDLDRDSYQGSQGHPDLNTFNPVQSKCRPTVVCSVAPNLPAPPSSNSDNESIPKTTWECEYEVYHGEPPVWPPQSRSHSSRIQEYSQYEEMEENLPHPMGNEHFDRYDGFPFPLDHYSSRSKRAPLAPQYNDQVLEDFPDGDPVALLPSRCQNEYTAISYYPAELLKSQVPGIPMQPGYQKVHVRLSVAQPSYAECGPVHSQAVVPRLVMPTCYEDSDLMESDYGSCEEVMF
ncbi:protocadherin Fat 1-like isoform X1 [Carcharodon carcharias]|uniref:protocadherin Fat 1-like isoform X1 n=1 Tax=Carcharodon carcharias TaxID=13397 RepID=UPI001B7DD56C|nr:protocadherin Fat 1-like isoform X1 [Carcharodon carcharias]